MAHRSATMVEKYLVLVFCISLLGTFCFISITTLCYYTALTVVAVYLLRYGIDKLTDWEPTKGKAVLITGCDTGFGHELALKLDQLRCTVFAGCLHEDGTGARALRKAGSKRLHVISMDVASDVSVARAVKYVTSRVIGVGLWAIVNNAGFNVMGDVEFLNVPLYHKCINVNFYGAVRVTRSFLFLVRQQKGRVVNVSSGRGTFPGPRDSAYHVSKHCLETFSDSLRLEMKKFSVNVSVVLPGNFGSATACQNHVQFERYSGEVRQMWEGATDEMRTTYGEYYLESLLDGMAASLPGSATDPAPVIDDLVHALFSKQPRVRYIVSGSNGWFDKSANMVKWFPYLPTWLSDYIITTWTKCDTFPQK